MFITVLLKHFGREPSQVEGFPEDLFKFLVKASDAQFLEVEILFENLFLFHLVTVNLELFIVLHADLEFKVSLFFQMTSLGGFTRYTQTFKFDDFTDKEEPAIEDFDRELLIQIDNPPTVHLGVEADEVGVLEHNEPVLVSVLR